MFNRVNFIFVLFFLLTLGGGAVVFSLFTLVGFPLASEPMDGLIWWKITVLIMVLAYPFSWKNTYSGGAKG